MLYSYSELMFIRTVGLWWRVRDHYNFVCMTYSPSTSGFHGFLAIRQNVNIVIVHLYQSGTKGHSYAQKKLYFKFLTFLYIDWPIKFSLLWKVVCTGNLIDLRLLLGDSVEGWHAWACCYLCLLAIILVKVLWQVQYGNIRRMKGWLEN